MAIRTSSARDVDALLQQLRSTVPLERDAAIARLRIIGARARERVLSLVSDTSQGTEVRVAALKVVDAMDDARVRRVVSEAAGDEDPAIAIVALQVLRPWVTEDDDTSVLERVTALVTDNTRTTDVRRAALDALSDLPPKITQPLVESVSAQLSETPPLDEPATAGEWLGSHATASLGVLHDLLNHARARERNAQTDAERNAWLGIRVATHAALAARGSRIALYDVREMFEQARSALPIDLLTTLRTIGDMSCLEPLAHAWDAVSDDAWWRSQLRDTAQAILVREQATGRHAVVKRVKSRWPGFLDK